MERDRERLEERGGDEIEALRDRVRHPPWHDDMLRKTAMSTVGPTGDAEHLAVGAQVFLSCRAVGAKSAKNRRIERHPGAHGEVVDSFSDGIDGPRRFMPHDQRRDAAAGGPGESVDVAAADPAGSDPHADVARAGKGSIDIRERKFTWRREEKRFHVRSMV
jgi:hypothetical protein